MRERESAQRLEEISELMSVLRKPILQEIDTLLEQGRRDLYKSRDTRVPMEYLKHIMTEEETSFFWREYGQEYQETLELHKEASRKIGTAKVYRALLDGKPAEIDVPSVEVNALMLVFRALKKDGVDNWFESGLQIALPLINESKEEQRTIIDFILTSLGAEELKPKKQQEASLEEDKQVMQDAKLEYHHQMAANRDPQQDEINLNRFVEKLQERGII